MTDVTDDPPLRFNVIDLQTGKPADVQQIALKEEWAKDLIYCDIESFATGEDGTLFLLDETGRWVYCPDGRFLVVYLNLP